MTHEAKILVAGIGNIFFGDDAFGVEVAARLAQRPLPESVRLVDFGIRGLDLAYELLKPYELVIFVDAVPRGGVPGTLYVLEPTADELREAADSAPSLDTHGMDPLKVLKLAASLGARVRRLVIVGCEPTPPDAVETVDDMAMGLSPPVQAALDEAVRITESLITESLVQA